MIGSVLRHRWDRLFRGSSSKHRSKLGYNPVSQSGRRGVCRYRGKQCRRWRKDSLPGGPWLADLVRSERPGWESLGLGRNLEDKPGTDSSAVGGLSIARTKENFYAEERRKTEVEGKREREREELKLNAQDWIPVESPGANYPSSTACGAARFFPGSRRRNSGPGRSMPSANRNLRS